MTREEAIHFAECLKHNWTIDFNDMEDFCDMVIEALSEPRGDLISRKDALNLSCIITGREGDAETIKKCFEAYRDHIVVLPSAETHEIRTETHGVCSDLISRADAVEAVRLETGKLGRKLLGRGDILDIISALPSAEPCDKNAISREGLLKSWEELSPRGRTEFDQVIMTIPALPSAEAETVDCTEFIRWLTETVMDDGMWELNAVAYGEVIARKLTKLGVLEVKDDVYVYEPSAEPKTGEWVKVIDEETPNVTTWHYECDQCGAGRWEKGQLYCHNCGADMRGEEA